MNFSTPENRLIIPKLNIIHAEDELMIARLVGANLRFAGHNATHFDHPQQVLQALSEPNDWQLLITDGQMPGMSGQELVERIRKTNNSLATMLLSATTEDYDPSKFDAVRKKPFNIKDLLGGIEQAYINRQRILGNI